MTDLFKLFLGSPWLVVAGVGVALIFLGTLLWKILRSEEGFLFGYGNWVIGKWQGSGVSGTVRPDHAHVHAVAEPMPKNDLANLKRAYQLQTGVLTLSRTLDGDLAYLMMHDAGEWEPKVLRAMQTLVSGVTRVVHPSGRCRCGFFILDDSDRFLDLAVGEGYTARKRAKLALDHSCAGRAFLTGEDYYCKDILNDPVYFQSTSNNREFRSIACVPVRAGQAIFGVLCLDAEQPNAFRAEDFQHLSVFAAKMAVFCSFHALQMGTCSISPTQP